MPAASIVVIGLTPPRDRVRVTLRYDLPDPPDADLAAGIAGHAAGVISAQQLTAAIAVGYGPEPLVRPAADAVSDAAQRAGTGLHHVLRVQGGRYWSYRCGDQECCLAAGTPFDPAGLGQLVERSLRDLAQTRRRSGGGGIQRGQVPAVVGDVPQEPAGFQPRADLLAALDAPGPGGGCGWCMR